MKKSHALIMLFALMLGLTSCGEPEIKISDYNSSSSTIAHLTSSGVLPNGEDTIYVHYLYVGSESVSYSYNEAVQDVDGSIYGDGVSFILTFFSKENSLPTGTFSPANYDLTKEVNYDELIANKAYESSVTFFRDGVISLEKDGEATSYTGPYEIYSDWNEEQWTLCSFQEPITITKNDDGYAISYKGKADAFIGSEHMFANGLNADAAVFDVEINTTYVESEDALIEEE